MWYWAEIAEEYAFAEMMAESEAIDRAKKLKEWIHTTLDWEEIPLVKMTDRHLQNCINHFKLPKDNPYYKELERRFTNP